MSGRIDPDNLVERIYDAALNGESWPEMLCDIAEFCGMEHAMVVSVDRKRRISSVLSPRSDPESIIAYGEYWWQYDPVSPMADGFPRRFTMREEVGPVGEGTLSFYNDFLKPNGLGTNAVLIKLFQGDGAFANFALPASVDRDEIDSHARKAIRFLSPHLMRSAKIAHRLQRLEAERSALSFPLSMPELAGTVVVDSMGRILHVDNGAEEIFARADVSLNAHGGRVGVDDRQGEADLHAALATATRSFRQAPPNARLTVSCNGQSPVAIDVVPFRQNFLSPFSSRAVAILLIRRTDGQDRARAAFLRQRFGFTPKEAVVVAEILKGDGRAAVAERCGISINTVRTHLERIFEKTGVRRQAELIRVLMDALE